MDELIDKIEETISYLLQSESEKYENLARQIVEAMMAIFPAIIASYSDPRMSDLREDATYWPGQLERIITALAVGDDVLFDFALEIVDQPETVVAVHDRVPERQLIPVVERHGDGRIDAVFAEELLKPSDQHLRLFDLVPFKTSPVQVVELVVARQHFVRTRTETELGKQRADRGALRCFKVQERIVDVP